MSLRDHDYHWAASRSQLLLTWSSQKHHSSLHASPIPKASVSLLIQWAQEEPTQVTRGADIELTQNTYEEDGRPWGQLSTHPAPSKIREKKEEKEKEEEKKETRRKNQKASLKETCVEKMLWGFSTEVSSTVSKSKQFSLQKRTGCCRWVILLTF